MISDQPRATADYATMFRAAHLYFDDQPKIFEDPIAFELLEPPMRVLLKLPGAFRAIQAIWPVRPARAQILVRSRYAEDRLADAIRRGVRQYVILGAGFDTFALRRPATEPPLDIFELDLEVNQRRKVEKLERLADAGEHNVHYVPINCESGSVSEALHDAGCDRSRSSFFSWLGVVHYMRKVAFLRTLSQVADCASPGSELVFDYRADGELSRAEAKRSAQVGLATETR